MKFAAATLDAVCSALPDGPPGIRPAAVHRRLDMLSLVTVRHVLRELCAQGRASYLGVDCLRHYYRLHQEPSP